MSRAHHDVEVPWEVVNDQAERLRVPGGWIYLVTGSEEHALFVPEPGPAPAPEVIAAPAGSVRR